jgi:peptidyl-prolyl cis-trans isomerase D
MLELIRQGAKTWTARILLVILALSFVYWGADPTPGDPRASVVAEVGDREITAAELERDLDLAVNQLSQRFGRRLTRQEAMAFGIDRQVLNRLVAATALDLKAQSLGLAVSELAAAESIARDPGFQGIDGKFDRQGFREVVRTIGMSEADFVALRRREEARAQLTESVAAAIVTPRPLVDAVHAWQQETRVVEYASIDAQKAVTVPKPDDAAVRATYDAEKSRFMAPEYRTLQVLMLTVEGLAERIVPTDAEIAKRYEETRDSFATPEQRRVQRLTFKDRAAAEAARTAISGGKNFMTVAQELGLTDTDVELGLVTRSGLVDPKIAEAAFALAKDTVSAVVDGRFGPVLLRVSEIVPGTQPTLEEVRTQVVAGLTRDRAVEDVRRLKDEIEDLRTAGRPDAEIAAAKGIKIVDIVDTDGTNKGKDGKPAFAHPDAAAIVTSGFDTRTGLDRPAVDLADGGNAWVTTKATTPARQKPFEEVAAEAETLHVDKERTRLMRELADGLVARMAAGEPMAAVVSAHGLTPARTAPITRTTIPTGLSATAVGQAFALAKDKAGHAESADRTGRTLLRVVEVTPAPAPTPEQVTRLQQEIGQQLQADTFEAFLSALQDGAGVRIAEAELRRALGATETR